MKALKFYIPQLTLVGILISCMGSENEVNTETNINNFAEFSMEILETLHDTYDANDLELSVTKDSNGNEKAIFKLKKSSQSDVLKSSSIKSNTKNSVAPMNYSEEGGTECNNKISCGKAIAECLDNGMDALISNGTCATYCVTCQEP